MRLLHISDLHIHESMADNAGVLKRLAYIREHYPRHVLVVTGDVTDDGSEKQYENAMHILPPGAYICPGNHDYGYAGNLYDPSKARRFGQYLPQSGKYGRRPVVDRIDNVVLIGLDSCLRTVSPHDMACGKIEWLQRFFLSRVLKRYQDSMKIVYFHHHPFDRSPWMGMKDAEKLLKVCRDCELLLFGHKHKAQQWMTMAAAGNLSECSTVTEITVLSGRFELNQVPVI